MKIEPKYRYTKDHEWAYYENDRVKVGITDYAQNKLGEIVYVEMPSVGDTVEKGKQFGVVESVKAVAELYAPMTGEVVEVNTALEDNSELINQSPYGEGWIIIINPTKVYELNQLMTDKEYEDYIKQLD